MADMTREEALKIIDQDICFNCMDIDRKCDKCNVKQAREMLWKALDKLEVYENADLIEREDAIVKLFHDGQSTSLYKSEILRRLRDIPHFNPERQVDNE